MFFKAGRILEEYGRSDGIASSPVRILNVDSDGGVWIASSGGLGHLKKGKIHTLGTKNGLPCDRVHWMQRDRNHQVWLYTACGLVEFPEDDLAAWSAELRVPLRLRTIWIIPRAWRILPSEDGIRPRLQWRKMGAFYFPCEPD